MTTPDRELVRLLALTPTIEVQRRLLRVSDRELALALQYFSDAERGHLLGRLGSEKAGRLRSELALLGRLRVRYEDYRLAVAGVTEALRSEKAEQKLKTYIRPPGRGRR